jgi:putative ABC transport system permease protein
LRVALGASRTRIMATVFRGVGVTVAIGLATGVALTAVLDRPITQWTESNLWNLRSLGPAILLLALVGLCAILMSARRAAAVEPMDVLRVDV